MAEHDTKDTRRRVVGFVAIFTVVVIALVSGVYIAGRFRSSPQPQVPQADRESARLAQARTALEEGRYREVEELLQEAVRGGDMSAEALLLAAEAALRAGDSERAGLYLRQLMERPFSDHADALARAGDLCWQVGRVRQAEELFRRAIRSQPNHVLALRRLAFILAVEGRRWETEPLLFQLLKQNDILMDELVLLGDLWPDYNLPSETRRYLAAVPDDPLPRLGPARDLLHRFQYAEARRWLEAIVAHDAHLVEAHAWLGWIISQTDDTAEMAHWDSQLPPQADEHPQVWYVRGLAEQKAGRSRSAMRCFWEAARRDPNHDQAHYQLGVGLAAEERHAEAARFGERAERLFAVAAALKDVYNHREQLAGLPDGEEKVRRVAELCRQLGRLWEARQWCLLWCTLRPTTPWAQEMLLELERHISPSTPRTLVEPCPAFHIDLSSYPLPPWVSQEAASAFASDGHADGRAGNALLRDGNWPMIRFEDRAPTCRLHFVAYNGDDPTVEEVRLLESTGNGVGIVDFDGDLLPDFYLTQACPWPPDGRQVQYGKQLFRNVGDGTFRDVTPFAAAGDTGFGQGVAVGDFDNDGFPDIFVANIGANRLYRNQGDGTFQLVWQNESAQTWTTSCALADVNGDSWPDIYEVNYLSGDVFRRRCFDGRQPRTCPPSLFPAAQDRLWLNLGDGRFEDITERAGIVAEGGKGLGVVLADFDHRGQLSIFVANDGTPNFYFVNTAARGQFPAFENRAFLTGLACDRLGRFQASMGVAVADADHDGYLDLLVTNFYDEINALYINRHRGLIFRDEAALRGLGPPSLKLLGFGAQFVDANLDGWPDLLVTNGHIEDRSAWGQPFRMPTQFFLNTGLGQFVELPPSVLGPFFQRPVLGRGMARCDWNGDGREDVVISLMNEPVALLTNETPVTGNVLAVELRGTRSDRDAVGARVSITVAGKVRTAQITAGDGYMASNQKQIVFGLANQVAERLTVRWPSGLRQEWQQVPVNRRIIIVEGRQDWLDMPFAR